MSKINIVTGLRANFSWPHDMTSNMMIYGHISGSCIVGMLLTCSINECLISCMNVLYSL